MHKDLTRIDDSWCKPEAPMAVISSAAMRWWAPRCGSAAFICGRMSCRVAARARSCCAGGPLSRAAPLAGRLAAEHLRCCCDVGPELD